MSTSVIDSWRTAGRPTAAWAAKSEDAVESVRLGIDEIAPDSVQPLRTFSPTRPCPFGRLRLLRVHNSGRAFGAPELYLLGGEPGMAGSTSEVPIDLGNGIVKTFGVLHTAVALAAILPVESRIDEMSDAGLTDLFLTMLADLNEAHEAARRGVKALFHHEDELLSVTVIDRGEGGELRLSFGLEVHGDAAGFLFDAERVPASLRPLLKSQAVFEPQIQTGERGRLVEVAQALVAGRIRSFAGLGWEGALCGHSPRRLFTIETEAGTVAFAVRLDDVAKRPLQEILEAVQTRRLQL